MNLNQRLQTIVDILDQNKAEHIEWFNLEGSTYMVDGVVVATALAAKHLDALLDHLKNNLKPQEQFLHTESSDDWIVVDMGDIIVHLMVESARQKYHLETFLKEFEAKKGVVQ
jgi:ribosome silencing factor RsfS/YbeB/iojap